MAKFGWHEAVIGSSPVVMPLVRPALNLPEYIQPTRDSASRSGV